MKNVLLRTSLIVTTVMVSACQSGLPMRQTQQLQSLRANQASLLRSVDGEGDMLRHGPGDMSLQQLKGFSLRNGSLVLAAQQTQAQYVSPPLQAPQTFNAVMPAWQSTGLVQLQLRLSSDGKNWGAWLPVMPERSMLLPQSARWVQYQIQMQAGPVAPSFQGLSFSVGQQRPLGRSQRRAHSIPKPDVMPRDGWKAVPPKGDYTPHTPVGIVIHHTWMPKQAQYQKESSIRGIQRYHMVDNKWMDIGYHFIIGPEGVIYQGRPETVVGAHSTPNTGMIGICVFGDFDPGQDPFTPEVQAKLLDLMTWLTAEYGIDTKEFYGHRDFSTKSCPGDEVYKHLQFFKDEVKRRLIVAGVLPGEQR